MTPTLEEVKRVAIECGMFRPDGTLMTVRADVLQAFAQHYIEVGEKRQREKDAALLESTKEYKSFYMKDGKQKEIQHLMNMDTMRVIAISIRNNTGE